MKPDDITVPKALANTHELSRTYWDASEAEVRIVHAAKRDTPKIFDGPAWYFRKDGSLWAEREYRDGRVWTAGYSLDPEGAKLDVGDLSQGEGRLRSYHDNGKLSSEGSYAGGHSLGTWQYFTKKGVLKTEGDFVGSQRRGDWRYFKDGAKTPYLTEDYREDGSAYVIYWEGKRRSSEGLRRKNDEGRWVDDGTWKEFENGNHTYSVRYDMGVHQGRRPNPAPVLAAMAKHSAPEDQLRAIKKAAKHNQVCDYLEPLHETGELLPEVAVAIALEGWSHLWSSTFPVILSYGEAALPAVESEASALASQRLPNDNRSALVCLWRWELGGKQPLPDLYGPLLLRAMMFNGEFSEAKMPVVERLRALVTSYPLPLREAAVTSQAASEAWRRGTPILAYAGLAPTGASIDKALEQTLSLKKNAFRYNPARTDTLQRFFEECGELALPAIIACMNAKGAKAQGRQILLAVLAKSGSGEAASVLLAHTEDKIEAAARAARDGIEALGAKALPALEAALSGRKKKIKLQAAHILSKLPPSPETRAVAEARLAKEKNAEIRGLLEPIVSGQAPEAEAPEETHPMIERIEAARVAVAPRAEALIAALEEDKGWPTVEANSKKLIGESPDVAVFFADRINSAHRKESPGIRGLDYEKIGRPLRAAGETELAAWLIASICAAVEEKRPYNLKYVLPRMRDIAGDELAVAITWFLSRGNPVPAVKPILRWLIDEAPTVAWPAFVAAADHRGKPVRKLAVEGLVAAGESGREALHGLLCGSTREQAVAAEALRATPSAASVAALEAAVGKEKNKKRREALASALLASRLAAGEVQAAALDAALSARVPAKVPTVTDAPQVRWRDGQELSEGAFAWLIAALATEDGTGASNEELRLVCAALTKEDGHALSRALIASFPDNNAHRWVRYQRALLGDDAIMDALGKKLHNDVYQHSAAYASHGVEVLRRNPTPAAIRWLDHYARKSKGKLEKVAAGAMEQLVRDGGLERDDLVDLATPTTDNEAARAAIAERLEAAMCTERRWSKERWRGFFVDHPVVSSVASQLLFGVFTKEGIERTFRLTSGVSVGVDGAEIDIPDGALIGIPHPVELDDDTIEAWLDVLPDPPFEQLDRPFTRDAAKFLDGVLPAPAMETRAFIDGIERLGYRKGRPQDAGWIYDAQRKVGSAWTIELSHDGVLASTGRSPNGTSSILQSLWARGPEGVPTPPALQSEALKDARSLVPTLV